MNPLTIAAFIVAALVILLAVFARAVDSGYDIDASDDSEEDRP